ncbi:MAG TPA: hypothetical protein VG253_11205 [Streptosporangiaceae bacterium]|jgi:protein-tyrosine-phosphatase|nr:hypothetical protein [Streptosporangiaceae bacterium]
MTDILVLCTANICRSPMAAALLSRRLAAAGSDFTVRSAGMLAEGAESPAEVVAAMATYGIDVSGHHSRLVTAGDLSRADLIVGMTRVHVRHAVVLAPQIWPRAFTLKELVRRAQIAGARTPAEPLRDWLGPVSEDRDRTELLGDSVEDDVADPIGGPPQAYVATAALLDNLAASVVELCWSGRP